MNPQQHDDRLARHVDAQLAALPPICAPESLAARVFAEIARREAMPWWRRAFRAWPRSAQVGFVLFAVALSQLLTLTGIDFLRHVDWAAAGSAAGDRLESVTSLFSTFDSLLGSMARVVPQRWAYGGVALIGLFYALLIGGSTFAFRALYARRGLE
jgi:hypothetical protein